MLYTAALRLCFLFGYPMNEVTIELSKLSSGLGVVLNSDVLPRSLNPDNATRITIFNDTGYDLVLDDIRIQPSTPESSGAFTLRRLPRLPWLLDNRKDFYLLVDYCPPAAGTHDADLELIEEARTYRIPLQGRSTMPRRGETFKVHLAPAEPRIQGERYCVVLSRDPANTKSVTVLISTGRRRQRGSALCPAGKAGMPRDSHFLMQVSTMPATCICAERCEDWHHPNDDYGGMALAPCTTASSLLWRQGNMLSAPDVFARLTSNLRKYLSDTEELWRESDFSTDRLSSTTPKKVPQRGEIVTIAGRDGYKSALVVSNSSINEVWRLLAVLPVVEREGREAGVFCCRLASEDGELLVKCDEIESIGRHMAEPTGTGVADMRPVDRLLYDYLGLEAAAESVGDGYVGSEHMPVPTSRICDARVTTEGPIRERDGADTDVASDSDARLVRDGTIESDER